MRIHVLILFTLFASAIASASPTYPVVVGLKGEVQILTKTGDNLPAMTYGGERYFYQKARIGLRVPAGAVVLCANEARAKLIYPSGTTLWVGQSTMVKVVEAEEAAAGETSLLQLSYGRLRALVTKSAKEDKTKWEIRTPTAVNGVRGTDFTSRYTEDAGNEVAVLNGTVEVAPLAQPTKKQEVKPDQAAHETAPGTFKVESISKVQVLSAYELTVITTPKEEKPEPQVAELETKSRELLAAELGTAAKSTSEADLSRKVTEKHLQTSATSSGEPNAEPFSHDLDNYKKMDGGK